LQKIPLLLSERQQKYLETCEVCFAVDFLGTPTVFSSEHETGRSAMTAQDIMQELRGYGSETTKKTMMRHGVREP
jgi:hypothetical protein